MSISDLTHFEFNRFHPHVLKLEPVHENLIAKLILQTKSNAQGPDKINMDMVLLTLPNTLSIITAIINKSITSCSFPSLWKTALVCPIPKKANPTCVKDLRPISLLCFLSKILEKVIYQQVSWFCEYHRVLPELQSGFRKNRSTNTALLDVVDNILSNQDKGMGTILTLLDFSRAFDSININLLLSKMTFYGFDVNVIRWFESYLTGRHQQVIIRKKDGAELNSRLTPLSRGVPQGSVLGPLLFILYSADIASCFQKCNYHIYADDVQLYKSINLNNIAGSVNDLNDDLERTSAWAHKNALVLNPNKSKCIIMGSDHQIARISKENPEVRVMGLTIEYVNEARNLGILVDNRLRFETHVAELVKNCFFRLKVLYQIRPLISVDVRVSLCDSLVLSKLNYGITVYGPCIPARTQQLIQRVQNACARYCFHIPPRTHVTPFLNNANMLKMKGRLKLFYHCLVFDILKTGRPEYLYKKLYWRSEHVRTRTCATVFRIPPHKSAAYRGCFKIMAAKCWNDLPPPLRSVKTKSKFKKEIRSYLLDAQKLEC